MVTTGSAAGRTTTGSGSVVVVGSISVDLTAAASPLPRPGETVFGTRFTTVLGGKGANQAVAAARAGARTTMVGAVGRDPFAGVALDALRADRVDTRWVDGGRRGHGRGPHPRELAAPARTTSSSSPRRTAALTPAASRRP